MSQGSRKIRIGVDIGGTFTDLIAWAPDGSIVTQKVRSTPENFARGILNGLALLMQDLQARPAEVNELLHATTVATNAILSESGAKTALITTKGFRDVLELRRIRIPELYNLFMDKPHPMVSRRLRLEVAERFGPLGEVRLPLNMSDVAAAVAHIAAEEVEAVAICFLHSYVNPDHERRVAEHVRNSLSERVFVTSSEELVPEIREYERTSSVVINAYVGPIVRDYLTSLVRELATAGYTSPVQIMMSNGGLMAAATAIRRPAAMVESGPAAGVIAAAFLARACEIANVITLDMGGTTAKAGLIEEGQVARTSEYEVGAGINVSGPLVKGRGHALKLPVVDLSEIGAGGGSIAVVDAHGILHVGPESAGADPGPVCYDFGGTRPTLADAMAVLGYLNPEGIAGGTLPINVSKARTVIEEKVARPLGKSVEEAALGVVQIAALAMTRAVKAVSTYRGRDPREFVLFAFGGNGPLAAARIAEELSMNRIVVPMNAGVFSAFGLLVGNAEHELTRSFPRRTDALEPAEVAAILTELEARAREIIASEGYDSATAAIRRFADLRYSGQAYELTVAIDIGPVSPDTIASLVVRFHEEHARTYGHSSVAEPVDLVNLRVQAVIPSEPLDEFWRSRAQRGGILRSPNPSRMIYYGAVAGHLDTPVITREGLSSSDSPGPLIIEDYDSTCLVPPGWSARVDEWMNIVLERR